MPMNEKEFDAYCALHALRTSAIEFLKRVRQGEPSRLAKSRAKNVASRYSSDKMGLTIQAESLNPEFAYVIITEFDDDIIEYYDQVERLQVRAIRKDGKSRLRGYTPDYLVLSRERGPVLVECKRDEEVIALINGNPNWWINKEGVVHYEPLRLWGEENGIGTKVVRQSELPQRRVQNLLMLQDYLVGDVPLLPQLDQERVLSAFADCPWAARRSILDANPKIEADHLNWMIAQGKLYVDLDNQVLADDVRTLIFRNRESALAYEAMQHGREKDDGLGIRSIILDAGESVVLDGVQHSVLQVGETHVILKDGAGRLKYIRWQDVDTLIAQKLLVADPMAESTTAAAAAERLRSASPDDIQQALENLAKLKSDPAQVYVPERTREWLRARYREGELKYGDGFLGLLGKAKEKGNRTAKVNPAVIDLTTQVVEELLLVKGATTKAASYGELRLRCIEKALTPPSEKFFRSFVNHINKQRLEEATKGRKAAHQYETWVLRLEYATPRHGQRPFEIGHIDHTELDLQMRDETYGTRTLKAWLTVLIDAYSRTILAWHLTFDSPSSSSLMCVIRECLRKHGRGCDIYVVDQGSEFNSKYFEALLARLRASKRERPASKPRFGNIIERFFRTVTDDFIKQLRGANEILKKPRSVSPSHDPRRSAIWTLRSFMKEWEHWLESFYHEVEHGTLGASPNTVFEAGLTRYGYRMHRRFAFDDALKVLCLPAVKTKDECVEIDAHHGYVRLNGSHYLGPILSDGGLHRHRVPARYNPFDISRLYIYVHNKWAELRSPYAGDLEGYSYVDLKIFSEELKAKFGKQHVKRAKRLEQLALNIRAAKQAEENLMNSHSSDGATLKADQETPTPRSMEGGQREIKKQPAAREFDVAAHWEDAIKLAQGE